jgi:hypothetical protein
VSAERSRSGVQTLSDRTRAAAAAASQDKGLSDGVLLVTLAGLLLLLLALIMYSNNNSNINEAAAAASLYGSLHEDEEATGDEEAGSSSSSSSRHHHSYGCFCTRHMSWLRICYWWCWQLPLSSIAYYLCSHAPNTSSYTSQRKKKRYSGAVSKKPASHTV